MKGRINTKILQVIKFLEKLKQKRFHTDLVLLVISAYLPSSPEFEPISRLEPEENKCGVHES